jgi:hypothetical protein
MRKPETREFTKDLCTVMAVQIIPHAPSADREPTVSWPPDLPAHFIALLTESATGSES